LELYSGCQTGASSGSALAGELGDNIEPVAEGLHEWEAGKRFCDASNREYAHSLFDEASLATTFHGC